MAKIMDDMKIFTNDGVVEDVEQVKSQRSEQPLWTLDDVMQEDDDINITGDNILKTVQVRKPGQQEFFRAHPTWQVSPRVVITKTGFKETVHFIHKNLMPPSKSLEQDSVPALVSICINLKGRIFIWVVRKSKTDGDPSSHYADALQTIQTARMKWVRHFWLSDQYRHARRIAELPDEPAWPENITLQDVLIAGFGNRIITSEDDPVLRELRGEISNG